MDSQPNPLSAVSPATLSFSAARWPREKPLSNHLLSQGSEKFAGKHKPESGDRRRAFFVSRFWGECRECHLKSRWTENAGQKGNAKSKCDGAWPPRNSRQMEMHEELPPSRELSAWSCQLVGFVSVGISLNWCVCFMLSTWHDNEQPPTRFRAVATIENRLVCG